MASTKEEEDTVERHLGELLGAIRSNGGLPSAIDGPAIDPQAPTEVPREPPPGSTQPSLAIELRKGTLIRGTWELSDPLGKGGFGQVFTARHLELQRDDAIKFLHPYWADDQEVRERFKHEARVMARMQGEHLVRVHDYGEHQQVPFFVMERLQGESLHSLLTREGALSLSVFFQIAGGLLRGLAEVHDAGVVHRDLKPANIFVLADGNRVKLLDFGLAMTSQRLTSRAAVMGTPLYMAPELLLSPDAEASVASDVYSAGVMLYQMLCGELPFTPRGLGGLAELVQQIASSTPRSLRERRPEIPEALEAAVWRAIDRDPARRPKSARELLAMVEQVRLGMSKTQPMAAAGEGREDVRASSSSSGELRHETAAISTAPTARESPTTVAASAPAAFPWPIFFAIVGMLIFWAWGLHNSTPTLPWFWEPLALLALALGGMSLLLARSSSEERGWLVDKLQDLRVFFQSASATVLLSWASHLLDRFYGERIFSWKAFRRSAFVSCSAAVIQSFVLGLLVGNAVADTAFREFWFVVMPRIGLGWLILNILSDFLSVACTRGLLRRVRAGSSSGMLALLMVLDTLALLLLGLVPTGIAASAVAMLAGMEPKVHLVIWSEYLLGSLIGTSSEPQAIQSMIRWFVFITLFTACVPSLFIWSTFVSALAALPGQGILYQRAANMLGTLGDTRSAVTWGYPILAFTIIGVGMIGADRPQEGHDSASDITFGIWERNCERGVAQSCGYLGRLYWNGHHGVKIDRDHAVRFFEKSCRLGALDDCVALVIWQNARYGAEPDFDEMRRVYDATCRKGGARACAKLGNLHERGLAVEKSIEQARHFYEVACDLDDDDCFDLPRLYGRGLGVARDVERAVELLSRACRAGETTGNAKACASYERIGSTNQEGLDRARRIYEEKCAHGYSTSCIDLGNIFLLGRGVERDPTHAYELFEQACRQWDGFCAQLGHLYHQGDGVARDPSTALHYYEISCRAGTIEGCTGLGLLLVEGQGVEQDFTLARRHFEKSCNLGHIEACIALGLLYSRGQGVEQDTARAKSLFSYVCDQGTPEGCAALGELESR